MAHEFWIGDVGALIDDAIVVVALAVLTLAVAAGCSRESSEAMTQQAKIRLLQPEDETLAQLYRRSCANCHAIVGTGAPLTGDREAWQPLLAKGMDTLVAHVRRGFGRMPASGLCLACSDQQYRALIEFMANADVEG